MNQCLQCGENITEYRSNKQYCSNACKQKAYRNGNAKNDLETIPDAKFIPEFIQEITVETREVMQLHFSGFHPYHLNLFIYYQIKWNLTGDKFIKHMKWYLEDEFALYWYYKTRNPEEYSRPTKEEAIEYEMYCQFIKAFNANNK